MDNINKQYPLYPLLSEVGQSEAQLLIDKFKKELAKSAEDAITELYCNIVPHIESDSWSNFRNQLMDGFKNYNNRLVQNKWDFKTIRTEIFKEFKTDIINDLNQDIYEENLSLKKQLLELREFYEKLYR